MNICDHINTYLEYQGMGWGEETWLCECGEVVLIPMDHIGG